MKLGICDFGCGLPAIRIFKSSGKKCCSENTSKCPSMKKRNNSAKIIYLDEEIILQLQEKYDSGLSWELAVLSIGKGPLPLRRALNQGRLKSRTKNQAAIVAHEQGRMGEYYISEESRTRKNSKIAVATAKRHADGWDNKAGRCKKYKYYSEIAGEITLDGTWELETAKWLDKNEYNWKRNKNRFEYTNLTGKIRHYTPDFWVEELGGYLEIKGYETDLDRCKWSQFPDKLTVWKKKELKENGVLP
jgi:hypothetical protein